MASHTTVLSVVQEWPPMPHTMQKWQYSNKHSTGALLGWQQPAFTTPCIDCSPQTASHTCNLPSDNWAPTAGAYTVHIYAYVHADFTATVRDDSRRAASANKSHTLHNQ